MPITISKPKLGKVTIRYMTFIEVDLDTGNSTVLRSFRLPDVESKKSKRQKVLRKKAKETETIHL